MEKGVSLNAVVSVSEGRPRWMDKGDASQDCNIGVLEAVVAGFKYTD